MRDRTVRALSSVHTLMYRATRGALGRRLPRVGAPMLLLTTTGRRSGDPRTVPLLFLDDGDAYAVIASYGGRDHHPAWYLNLEADPNARVQVDGRTEHVVAESAEGEERARLWAAALEAYPGYAGYQSRTERAIPIVLLRARSSRSSGPAPP